LFEFTVVADQLGAGEAVLQIAGKFIRIVTHENGANAPIALRHEDSPEGAFANGKTDFRVRAAGAIIGRRHTQNLIRLFIETAVGVVTGVENESVRPGYPKGG
jgi:hypothetical protein